MGGDRNSDIEAAGGAFEALKLTLEHTRRLQWEENFIDISFPAIISMWKQGRDAQREDARKAVLKESDLNENGSSDGSEFVGNFGEVGNEKKEGDDEDEYDDNDDEDNEDVDKGDNGSDSSRGSGGEGRSSRSSGSGSVSS